MTFELYKMINLLYDGKYEEANEYKNNNMPKTLFKYIGFSEVGECSIEDKCPIKELNNNKITTIKDDKIWLSTYDNLNDPFELNSLYISQEKLNQLGYPVEAVNKVITEIKKGYLIGSFTTNYEKNLPMWAHYANNHKGICIEYEVKEPKFIYPISYEHERVEANSIYTNYFRYNLLQIDRKLTDEESRLQEKYFNAIHYNSCIKNKLWDYEDEYRILYPNGIVAKSGALINLSTLGLKINKIYLGLSLQEEYKEKLKTICKSKKIRVHQMIINQEAKNYELADEEIK